jgi:murein DD-endopeptidase MepM/ murein hydrolase activator NlpD
LVGKAKWRLALACVVALVSWGASVVAAHATAGSDWLPVVGASIPVKCTWSNGCSDGYHGYPAIDFGVPYGSSVYGSGTGTVVAATGGCSPNIPNANCNGGRGNYVEISHGTHTSRYLHLSAIAVGVGARVGPGQRIGSVGNSGYSEGAHLHYDEMAGGGKISPGALHACHGGSRVSYGTAGWNAVSLNTPIRNDGYGCINGNEPRGSLDSVTSPEAGKIRVGGWALDDDARTAPVRIHVYVGAQVGQAGAEGHDIGNATVYRPDVGRAFPGVGDQHGFDTTIVTSKTGNIPVCVYAINIGGGTNPLIACKHVNVTDPQPRGTLDYAGSPEPGTVEVSGWALDMSAPTRPLAFHVYVGGRYGVKGIEGHAFPSADRLRPDVNRVYPGVGDNHGFGVRFATARVGRQEVCAYAINVGVGANQPIGCKTVVISPRPPSVPLPPATPQATPLSGSDLRPPRTRQVGGATVSVRRTPGRVGLRRRAKVATVKCHVRRCVLRTPEHPTVRIGKRKFQARVIVPTSLRGGGQAPIVIHISPAAYKRLGTGATARTRIRLTVQGGGHAVTRAIAASLSR